jgi:DNA-directed RNA polymerase specialized sigma24 family protein
MHGCVRVNLLRDQAASSPAVPVSVCEQDAGLAYARLRLDLLRLARQLTDPDTAESIVQDVFRHVVRRGAAAPRDARGIPRPAYLASLVHAFAARRGVTALARAHVGDEASRAGFGPPATTGARGG